MATQDDPLGRAKLLVAYLVAVVWATIFLASLIDPPEDSTALLAAQATMMAIIGGLFIDRYVKRNGKQE